MSKALLKYIRLSPTKARLIAREVQGMNAEIAIASLEFTPNKAARIISKVIASAVANGGYDAQNVFITSCRVDAGPVLRRFMPRAKGRATPIRKPTAHILVEVGTQKKVKKVSKDKESSKELNEQNKNTQKKQTAAQTTKSVATPTEKPSKPKTTKTTKAAPAKQAQSKKKTEGEEK